MNTNNLYLVRHGQSIYNLENRFTGWKDVELTELGQKQAEEAGNMLRAIQFDIAFVSVLKRAKDTLNILLGHNNNGCTNIIENIALNERDYGDLIGQNKSEAAKKFGDEQVQIWRRSYNVPPPGGESLEMTAKRTLPYYKEKIAPSIISNKNIIISAHGNSLRAIVMSILKLSPEEILKTEIGWCEPWKFCFDSSGNLSNYEIMPRESEPSKSSIYK